jgi:hypothetical protein
VTRELRCAPLIFRYVPAPEGLTDDVRSVAGLLRVIDTIAERERVQP